MPTRTYFLYSSAEAANNQAPLPMNMYELSTSGSMGPIPSSPTHSTDTKFCVHGTTPSVSANSTSGGIVWAIERGNAAAPTTCAAGQNNGNWNEPAILHAYNATNISGSGLYTSSGNHYLRGVATKFSTPTVYHGRVYMGTLGLWPDGSTGEVDVFGLCGGQSQPACLN